MLQPLIQPQVGRDPRVALEDMAGSQSGEIDYHCASFQLSYALSSSVSYASGTHRIPHVRLQVLKGPGTSG